VKPSSQPPLVLSTALTVVLVVVLYHTVLSYPFVWTDHTEVEQQVLVPTSLQDWSRTFTLAKGAAKPPPRQAYQAGGKATGTRYAYYRPIKAATYGIDWATGGGSPGSFHLTNLLLHAGCCVMLLVLGRRLWGHRHPYLAEAVALLHAVFPVHVEAVAWISARSDILWGLFTLGGIILLLRSRQARHRWPYLLGTSLMVLLSAGSKESGLASLGILLLFSGLIPDEKLPSRFKRLMVECGGPAVAGAAYVLFRLVVVSDVHIGALGAKPGLGLWTTLHLFGLNLAQSFLPVGLTVADSVEIVAGPTFLGAAGPVLWTGWLMLGWRLRRRSPVLLLAALGWLVSVAPVSQLVPLLHPRGERYLYVPAMFAEMSLVWVAWTLAGRLRSRVVLRTLGGAGVVTLLCLALLSFARLKPWSDERRLFAEAVQHHPHCAECWNNLAYAEALRGRYRQASLACLRGLSVDMHRHRGARDGFSLRWILAKSLLLQGRGHEAVRWITEIIQQRGTTEANLGMLAQALWQAVRSCRAPATVLLWVPSILHPAPPGR
jgi:hypothetical protein